MAAGRRYAIDQGDELGDVVAVGGSQRRGQGNALALAGHSGAWSPHGRGRPARGRSLRPPLARTCELSTAARDQSSCSASCNSSSSTWCRRSQTPASFQSRSRRQHVIARPAPHLLRQMLPRDPGFQDEQDARQRGSVGHPPATRISIPPPHSRQQRLDPIPQTISNQGFRHGHRLQRQHPKTSFC